jgi:hypothetical protein
VFQFSSLLKLIWRQCEGELCFEWMVQCTTVHSLQAYIYNMIYLSFLLQRVVSFGSVSTSLRLVNPLKE